MNIYQKIKSDHGKQRGLCAGLLNASEDPAERQRLFATLKSELAAHAAAEEQIFYAGLIVANGGHEQVRHSIAEHERTSDLLAELEGLDIASGGWLNKAKVFVTNLQHHMDEEEHDVFELARCLINDGRAAQMGVQYEETKNRILAA